MKHYILVLTIGLFLVACNLKDSKAALNPEKKENTERLDTLRFPKAEHYVNDFEEILTTNQEGELDRICADYEKKTTNQLVVATVKDLKPYNNIADFSKDMFNEWRIGTEKDNNGVLIVLCYDCQEVRITTGYGAEKILTNEVCDQIIDPGMTNFFEKKDPYGGLKYGVEEVIRRWK